MNAWEAAFKSKYIISDEDITYIHVSFKDKDKVKQLGGRWNSEKKSWFIFKTNKNYDELVKTYKKEKKPIIKEDIVYINVPYSGKEHAKELGARWCNESKCWYVKTSNQNYNELIESFDIIEKDD
jgi:hypothetical protein